MKYDLETLFKIYGIKFEKEYSFSLTRKWKADYWIIDTDILVEVEGGNWTQGRHIRGEGYENDCYKYNAAQIQGYIVLRYTPNMIKKLQEKIIHEIWKLQEV